jgi:putative FmdB family regulatory protein
MPAYIYFCKECDKEFEVVHSIHDELKECPTCHEEGREPVQPTRLIAGTNFILGSGGVGWSKEGYSSK